MDHRIRFNNGQVYLYQPLSFLFTHQTYTPMKMQKVMLVLALISLMAIMVTSCRAVKPGCHATRGQVGY